MTEGFQVAICHPGTMSKSAPKDPPSSGLAAYRRVLGAPHVLALELSSASARLPVGMSAVALILYVHGATGSFTDAGLVAGAYAVGLGVTGPFLARVIDRRGSELVIVPGAVVGALALVGVVAAGHENAGPLALALAAAVAGAATPPIGGVTRQQLPHLVAPADLPTIYALDSVMLESIFIFGPLLAAGIAATLGPGPAVLATAAVLATGAIWFDLLSRKAPTHREEAGRTGWLGALGSPTLRLLVLAGLPLGACFGVLDVVLPAFGSVHGSSALSGPFTAALGFGSALGGFLYGARPGLFGAPARALFVLGAGQVLTCLPILLVLTVPEMFAAAFLSGIFVAPLITVRYQLARQGALAGTGTEAFTWMPLAITVGASAGSALAGPIVQAGGWRAGAVLACALPALSVLVGLTGREALAEGASEALAA